MAVSLNDSDGQWTVFLIVNTTSGLRVVLLSSSQPIFNTFSQKTTVIGYIFSEITERSVNG